ncbi:MAG: hypothetical protein ACXWJW_08300 [Xanthobacteraceae bacterium]
MSGKVMDRPSISLASLFCGIAIYFAGMILVAILLLTALSASGCFYSNAIRCLSVRQDVPRIAFDVFRGWSIPSAVAASLMTLLLTRNAAKWWSIGLIAAITAFVAVLTVNPASAEFPFLYTLFSAVALIGLAVNFPVARRLCKGGS